MLFASGNSIVEGVPGRLSDTHSEAASDAAYSEEMLSEISENLLLGRNHVRARHAAPENLHYNFNPNGDDSEDLPGLDLDSSSSVPFCCCCCRTSVSRKQKKMWIIVIVISIVVANIGVGIMSYCLYTMFHKSSKNHDVPINSQPPIEEEVGGGGGGNTDGRKNAEDMSEDEVEQLLKEDFFAKKADSDLDREKIRQDIEDIVKSRHNAHFVNRPLGHLRLTMLQYAVLDGLDAVVDVLCKYGADPNFASPTVHSVTDLLSSEFQSVHSASNLPSSELNHSAARRVTALTLAIEKTNPSYVEKMIHCGVDMSVGADTTSVDADLPLWLAAAGGHMWIWGLILPEVEKQCRRSETTTHDDTSISNCLIAQFNWVNPGPVRRSVLHIAAAHGNEWVVRSILETAGQRAVELDLAQAFRYALVDDDVQKRQSPAAQVRIASFVHEIYRVFANDPATETPTMRRKSNPDSRESVKKDYEDHLTLDGHKFKQLSPNAFVRGWMRGVQRPSKLVKSPLLIRSMQECDLIKVKFLLGSQFDDTLHVSLCSTGTVDAARMTRRVSEEVAECRRGLLAGERTEMECNRIENLDAEKAIEDEEINIFEWDCAIDATSADCDADGQIARDAIKLVNEYWNRVPAESARHAKVNALQKSLRPSPIFFFRPAFQVNEQPTYVRPLVNVMDSLWPTKNNLNGVIEDPDFRWYFPNSDGSFVWRHLFRENGNYYRGFDELLEDDFPSWNMPSWKILHDIVSMASEIEQTERPALTVAEQRRMQNHLYMMDERGVNLFSLLTKVGELQLLAFTLFHMPLHLDVFLNSDTKSIMCGSIGRYLRAGMEKAAYREDDVVGAIRSSAELFWSRSIDINNCNPKTLYYTICTVLKFFRDNGTTAVPSGALFATVYRDNSKVPRWIDSIATLGSAIMIPSLAKVRKADFDIAFANI